MTGVSEAEGAAARGSPRRWTLEQLRPRVAGRDAFLRDADLAPVELPPPLRDVANPGRAPRWTDQMSSVHAEDRPNAVEAWTRARAEPGTPATTTLRYRDGDAWVRRHLEVLDLRHQPEVGGVLFVLGPAAPVEAAAPEPEEDAGPFTARAVWSAPPWALQRLDATGTIVHAEGRVEELLGIPAEELVGTNITSVIHPEDKAISMSMWLDVVATPGGTRTIRQRVLGRDGTTRWVESTVVNRLESPGPTGGVVLVMSHDVTGRLGEEMALRASQAEFRTLAEEVPVAVFRADRDGRITYANARWYALVGAEQPLERLEQLVPEADAARVRAEVAAAAAPGAPAHGVFEVAASDGRRFALAYRRVQAAGVPETLVGVLTDITETVELRRRAERDDLTGLLNRRALEDRLDADLRAGGHVVVAFVDLDGFKAINDRFGHDAGDDVLRVLGQRLGAALGPPVAVARWGGDEFVVVAPRAEAEASTEDALVARIHEALAEPVGSGARVWHPSASVGVAVGAPGDEAADLLRRADHAMYAQKRARPPRGDR